MPTVTLYHNPRCSKSRKTLELITEAGVTPDIVEYLKEAPTPGEIVGLASKLGVSVSEILRTGEAEYKDSRDAVDTMDDAALAVWMSANPKVIQRPIVVSDKGARIGRPPEAVLEILD